MARVRMHVYVCMCVHACVRMRVRMHVYAGASTVGRVQGFARPEVGNLELSS